MNKERRKRIEDVISKLESLKDEVYEILEEETEYRDNIPENLQQSERYEKADNSCTQLDFAFDYIGEVAEYLNDSIE